MAKNIIAQLHRLIMGGPPNHAAGAGGSPPTPPGPTAAVVRETIECLRKLGMPEKNARRRAHEAAKMAAADTDTSALLQIVFTKTS